MTTSTITPLGAWMRAATTAEKQALATAAGTSVMYLRHIAVDESKKYKRQPSAAIAAAVERETKAMHRATKGRLPIVHRTDLNATCRQCEFACRALGQDVITRGEFPVIEVKPE